MYKLITHIVIVILFVACSQNTKPAEKVDWYLDTKVEILTQSERKPDSTVVKLYPDSNKTKLYYLNGKIIKELYFRKDGSNGGETYRSDDVFELRREICPNGSLGFEGIWYDGKFYGLSTWYYCSGQRQKQIIRYRNTTIGISKEWDKEGNLTKQEDFKNLDKLDSFPQIKKIK